MSIKADCHLHSSFSGDSQAPMPEMIDKGLALGLETMCFTEHNDFDYPRTEEGPGTIFLLNTDSYLYDVLRCRAKYEGKNHSISKQTVKFTTKSQIFFIYILNYNQELGKMTLLIKF